MFSYLLYKPIFFFLFLYFSFLLGNILYRLQFIQKLSRRVVIRDSSFKDKEEFIKDLKTGDILLFSGHGWSSISVKCWSCTYWSHCGLIYINPENRVCLFHSDSPSTRKNIYTEEENKNPFTSGVQLNDLRLYIETFKGDILKIPLRKKLSIEKEEEFGKIIKELCIDEKNEFNRDWGCLLKCTEKVKSNSPNPFFPVHKYLQRFTNYKEYKFDSKKCYCSELVSFILNKLNIKNLHIEEYYHHPSSFLGNL